MGIVSFLTLWYLRFWNTALQSKCVPESTLQKILEGSFSRFRGSTRAQRALPFLSESLIEKVSLIFLNCFPLRKLLPFVVNLGFFFDRMIEYSIALQNSSADRAKVLLDIGSGYSFFPSYLASQSYTISTDINPNALIFQKKVSKSMEKNVTQRLECVVADSTELPFKDNSVDKIYVISTIEHIEKDSRVAKEGGRVLRNIGSCVMSFGFSKLPRETRVKPYFLRIYTREKIENRIIVPSLLSLEELFTFRKSFLSLFHKIVPDGWFIFKDLTIGLALFKLEKFLCRDKEGEIVVIKLRKNLVGETHAG